MKEFSTYIFGEGSLSMFFAALLYGYVGAFVSLLLNSTTRDPSTTYSPFCWSWDYFLSDNFKRILANIILIFLAIRFSKEWFGTAVTMWAALFIGFGFDKLAQKVKNIMQMDDKQTLTKK